jgi:hypothetical protein
LTLGKTILAEAAKGNFEAVTGPRAKAKTGPDFTLSGPVSILSCDRNMLR